MASVIKLSSPATREFWEIPVVYEDTHLLALNKPRGLLSSPDRHAPERPNLMKLLHAGIAGAKPWARERGLTYLMNAQRLDCEASGLLLLARSKLVLVALANWFGSGKPCRKYLALVHGAPASDRFEVDAKLAAHAAPAGFVRVDPRRGKRARTVFQAREKFNGFTLLTCESWSDRPHQIRAHLRQAGLPIVGDGLYGGRPLFLSRLKPGYRLKPKQVERPLLGAVALHAEELALRHPVTDQLLHLQAPWPKDLVVAVKYLRQYAAGRGLAVGGA